MASAKNTKRSSRSSATSKKPLKLEWWERQKGPSAAELLAKVHAACRKHLHTPKIMEEKLALIKKARKLGV